MQFDQIIRIRNEDFKVKYTEDAAEIHAALLHSSPSFFTYDTESTGLHVKYDKAFLGAVCWKGTVYVFPAHAQILYHMPKWARDVKRVYAHNTTFDMHMTANAVNDEKLPLRIKNWGDTMGLARPALEAVSARDGGDKLGLKELGEKYVDPTIPSYETAVKSWMADKRAANKAILIAALQGQFGKTGWGVGKVNEYLDCKTPIPEEALSIFKQWVQDYPEPTYQDVPLEIMIPYLAVDVIATYFLVIMCGQVVAHRQQQTIVEQEFRLLRTVYKMERHGLPTRIDYLMESDAKLDAEIDLLRERMSAITTSVLGESINENQSKRIADYYQTVTGIRPESTDKQFLNAKKRDGDELAEIISKLRRFSKWKSTYIGRILCNVLYGIETNEQLVKGRLRKVLNMPIYNGDRFYPTLNQFNPVSGRFSGDAQQFPKERILTAEGDAYEKEHGPGSAPVEMEVFYPRRVFTGRVYYLDYSQVELRLQAHYTLKFGGDLNLCRAYMPFKCVHYRTGEPYNFLTAEGRARWNEVREGAPTDIHWEKQLERGISVWVAHGEWSTWIPTDVHSSTTRRALLAMGLDPDKMSEKEWKFWRNIGKRFNFMRNYGGGNAKAAETLEIKIEEASAMNRGYSQAFPHVLTYQKDTISMAYVQGYADHPRGQRYYINNSSKFYKLANYRIQGWGAKILKDKMIEIDDFLEANECMSVMFLCVHDELQFDVVEGEDWIIPKIKAIMEDVPECMVPIVAEVEFTTTTWAEKKKVINVEELSNIA